MRGIFGLAALAATGLGLGAIGQAPAAASTLLYDQDFENPNPGSFVNDWNTDVNIFNTVNQLYSGQPAGFTFAQANTVETLLIGGTYAWGGTGFVDPSGKGGKYTLGMLSHVQDDLIGLSFDVGAFQYLNLRADISSIDLNTWGGPFVPYSGDIGTAPVFRFSLFDNPGGGVGLGSGSALDFFDVTGIVAPNRYTFAWSEALGGLDASKSTNGKVILRVDLLSGGYAAIDNLRIVASDLKGDVGSVPEPASWAMMISGFALVGAGLRRKGLRVRFA